MDFSRLVPRTVTLLCIGAALTLALNLLQAKTWAEYPGWTEVVFSAIGGTSAGLLYPALRGEEVESPDGSMVMRCVALFVGVYQASVKIEFSGYFDLAITLVALSVSIWWLFDRSQVGFIFSFLFSVVSMAVIHVLLYFNLINPIDQAFLYTRLWSIFFSGGVTFGIIGRRLANGD